MGHLEIGAVYAFLKHGVALVFDGTAMTKTAVFIALEQGSARVTAF